MDFEKKKCIKSLIEPNMWYVVDLEEYKCEMCEGELILEK